MLKLSEDGERFIEAVGNPSRIRILLALWKYGEELTVYKICRLTGLGRSSVRRHLNNLVENGLVTKKIYGSIVLYLISRENPRSNALIGFLKTVNSS